MEKWEKRRKQLRNMAMKREDPEPDQQQLPNNDIILNELEMLAIEQRFWFV